MNMSLVLQTQSTVCSATFTCDIADSISINIANRPYPWNFLRLIEQWDYLYQYHGDLAVNLKLWNWMFSCIRPRSGSVSVYIKCKSERVLACSLKFWLTVLLTPAPWFDVLFLLSLLIAAAWRAMDLDGQRRNTVTAAVHQAMPISNMDL